MGAEVVDGRFMPVGEPEDDERIIACVDGIIARYPDRTGRLLNVLNDVQESFRFLPPAAMRRVSERLGVPVSQIERMGAFFGYLSLDPVGRCILDVCDGTACHTLGAPALIAEFQKKLGVQPGQTTDDGAMTLRTVGCVGACGIAPVVAVEGEVVGRVRITDVPDIVDIAKDRAEMAVPPGGDDAP